jgi:hypothetical protein
VIWQVVPACNTFNPAHPLPLPKQRPACTHADKQAPQVRRGRCWGLLAYLNTHVLTRSRNLLLLQ